MEDIVNLGPTIHCLYDKHHLILGLVVGGILIIIIIIIALQRSATECNSLTEQRLLQLRMR